MKQEFHHSLLIWLEFRRARSSVCVPSTTCLIHREELKTPSFLLYGQSVPKGILSVPTLQQMGVADDTRSLRFWGPPPGAMPRDARYFCYYNKLFPLERVSLPRTTYLWWTVLHFALNWLMRSSITPFGTHCCPFPRFCIPIFTSLRGQLWTLEFSALFLRGTAAGAVPNGWSFAFTGTNWGFSVYWCKCWWLKSPLVPIVFIIQTQELVYQRSTPIATSWQSTANIEGLFTYFLGQVP